MMMSLLLTTFSFIVASDDRGDNIRVVIPSKEVLKQRLAQGGLEHFAKKSALIKNLSGHTKHVATVALAVESSLRNYEKTMKNTEKTCNKQELREFLLKAFLQDTPGALDELEKRGYYVPSRKE